MNTWNGQEIIIAYDGKNATEELKYGENIPGMEEIKRYVKIVDGLVVEKPEDIDIIGERTKKGFIVTGLKLNIERNKKCALCEEEKNIIEFWDKSRNAYSNVCNECREESLTENGEECSECWIR